MNTLSQWREAGADCVRVLLFQANADLYGRLGFRHLLIGLLFTWLAGVGRYWDHPNPEFFQVFGLGSLAYIFVLALLLWLVSKPMNPKAFSYFGMLTFISLTSPPAVFYAIPVEQWTDLATARSFNLWFLGIVALWRIMLLLHYLRVRGSLGWQGALCTGLLPMSLIIVALTRLNMEKAIFRVMAGLHPEDRTVNDSAYAILILLSLASVFLFIPFLIVYIVSVVDQYKIRKINKSEKAETLD